MRWRLVGNAVSVPVAAWIGERLRAPQDYQPVEDRVLRPAEKWPSAAYGGDGTRYAAAVSDRPLALRAPDLAGLLDLDEVKPLSLRATSGFLKRFQAGSLRRPEGFMEALENHLRMMEAE